MVTYLSELPDLYSKQTAELGGNHNMTFSVTYNIDQPSYNDTPTYRILSFLRHLIVFYSFKIIVKFINIE